MPRKQPRQHRRKTTLAVVPPSAPSAVTLDMVAHALCAGADASGGGLYHVLQAFKAFQAHMPQLDEHLLWHIEDEARATWVRHHHAWLREEYGDGWREEITTTPNPHGNCEDCLHPLGFYDQLFGDETPSDIDDCECGCHQTPEETVPSSDEGGA